MDRIAEKAKSANLLLTDSLRANGEVSGVSQMFDPITGSSSEFEAIRLVSETIGCLAETVSFSLTFHSFCVISEVV